MNVFVLLNTKEDILRDVGHRAVLGTIDFIVFSFPIEVNGVPEQPDYTLSSEYLPLCSAEQTHSYRFGNTWGWVNNDRIVMFEWTIPLKEHSPRVKRLSFTVFESIQPISGSGGSTFSVA